MRVFIQLGYCIALLSICFLNEGIAKAQTKPKIAAPETARTIQIGTEGAYPPFSYYNIKGELKGFDVDLANAICANLRYNCQWQVYDWQNLIDAVRTNKVQIVVASKSISDDLTKGSILSLPYYQPHYVIVYHRDNSPTGTSTTDLLNTTIGALKGTDEYEALKVNYSGSRIKSLQQLDTAFYALSRREIDYLVIDYNVVEPWLAAKGDGRCCVYRAFDQPVLNSERIKFLINTEATVVQAAFNVALKNLQDSGEVRKIATKHGLDPSHFTFSTIPISPYH